MYFLIGLLAAFFIAFVGRVGIQRAGNYENIWGALLLWTVPVYLVVALLVFMLL
jgi:hypothetical protein